MFSVKTDPDALQGFRQDQASLVRSRVKIILYFGIFLVPLFGVVDYVIYPQYIGRFMIYRLAGSALCMLLYRINQKWDLGRRSFYLGVVEFYTVGLIIIAMIHHGRLYESLLCRPQPGHHHFLQCSSHRYQTPGISLHRAVRDFCRLGAAGRQTCRARGNASFCDQ